MWLILIWIYQNLDGKFRIKLCETITILAERLISLLLLILFAKVKCLHKNKLACCMYYVKPKCTTQVISLHLCVYICGYILCIFHDREWISTCSNIALYPIQIITGKFLPVMVPRIINPFTWINLQLLQPVFLSLLVWKCMSSSYLIRQHPWLHDII